MTPRRSYLLVLPLLVLPLLAPNAYGDATVLGTADPFAVLAGSAVTNTGSSVISAGDLGVSPGAAISGFPPGIVNAPGTIHAADAVAQQAQIDLTTAYTTLAGMAVTSVLTGMDLGGLTLTPGVYFFANEAQLTGTLILDAQGQLNAIWVFQIGSALTTAANSAVSIINPGANDGLFWQVGSSATLGTSTDFLGNIVALTSITLNNGATDNCGRVLARNGAVTLDNNTISIGCENVPGESGSGGLSGGTALTPVPEPGTLLLLGTGLAGLVGKTRMGRARTRRA